MHALTHSLSHNLRSLEQYELASHTYTHTHARDQASHARTHFISCYLLFHHQQTKVVFLSSSCKLFSKIFFQKPKSDQHTKLEKVEKLGSGLFASQMQQLQMLGFQPQKQRQMWSSWELVKSAVNQQVIDLRRINVCLCVCVYFLQQGSLLGLWLWLKSHTVLFAQNSIQISSISVIKTNFSKNNNNNISLAN